MTRRPWEASKNRCSFFEKKPYVLRYYIEGEKQLELQMRS